MTAPTATLLLCAPSAATLASLTTCGHDVDSTCDACLYCEHCGVAVIDRTLPACETCGRDPATGWQLCAQCKQPMDDYDTRTDHNGNDVCADCHESNSSDADTYAELRGWLHAEGQYT